MRTEKSRLRRSVFEDLVPAFDFALGHRTIGRAAQVLDVVVIEPFGQ
jgi:hypothetical protein